MNDWQTSERNIREWLANQAVGGYVMYDAETKGIGYL